MIKSHIGDRSWTTSRNIDITSFTAFKKSGLLLERRGRLIMSLPVSNPTRSFWEIPPHRLAAYRSPLPEAVDVAIIGSGITGSSIARSLFELDPSLRIAIMEARTLCSGASGRNGGQCKPASYLSWFERVQGCGVDEAIAITQFEALHWSYLLSIVEKYGIQCDISEVESVDAYYNESQFKKGMDAAHEMSRHIPGWSFKVYTANEAQEFLRVSGNCVGAIVYPAGKIWAYKFVTQIVEILVNKGLNLQTETPVTRITPRKGKYAWHLDTPRGGIFASKVVLATNGYIQNLVPAFTKIRPTRDSMTIQRAPKSVSPSLNRSYIFYYKNDFDYLIEERQGDVNKLVFGGGLIKDPNPITYNDAEVADASRCHLQHQLPKVLKWEGEKFPQERVERCWSGIMGFSDDNLPWVGAVPESVGGGQDQWICAGYTGNGLSNALLCADALAKMLIGEGVPSFFPKSYLVSKERIVKMANSK